MVHLLIIRDVMLTVEILDDISMIRNNLLHFADLWPRDNMLISEVLMLMNLHLARNGVMGLKKRLSLLGCPRE
jgi:hypothetical protein